MLRLLLFILFALTASAQPPHLVVLLADDHSAADMGAHGAKEIPTPHLDRMAAAGMVFERAFVNSPSCAPSRAAIFTWLYLAKNSAEPNHAKIHANLKRLPAYLKEMGYETVGFGKTDTHHDAIFTTHTGDNNMNVYLSRAMRAARWKYIRNLHPEFRFTSHIDRSANEDSLAFIASWEGAAKTDPQAAFLVKRHRERPAEELYDLDADPFELNDLASTSTAQLDEVRRGLDAWMKSTGDTQMVAGKPLLLSEPFRMIGKKKNSK